MIEEKAGKRTSAKSDKVHKAASNGFATVESFLPTGSPQRAAVGVAAAAGGALACCCSDRCGPGSARWGSRVPRVPRDLSRVKKRLRRRCITSALGISVSASLHRLAIAFVAW